MIAQLESHPGWTILREWVREQRKTYFEELGRALFDKKTTVTEVDLAYKRGFFYGMQRLLNQPLIEVNEIQRELDQRSE